jgi:propionyl-CoA synthetase
MAHPFIAEAYVVALPDALKGELPFAFVVPTVPPVPGSSIACTLPRELLSEIQTRVRASVGGIATLGGAVMCGRTAVPRTRSGKTLRRVLRDILAAEMARSAGGEARQVKVPDTIDDASAVGEVTRLVRAYLAAATAADTRAKL